MQCCEFEMVVATMRLRIAEANLDRYYHRLDLAEMLMERGVTRVDRLPAVDAIVVGLKEQIRDVT